MYYQLLGNDDPNAPTLVFSSGLGGSAQFWQPQLPVLPAHFRVLVYDQLGTGRSPADLPEDYSIGHMAQELKQLLDELDIRRCHLIGHALGGLVALQLALTHPEYLQSQVLINAWSEPNPHSLRCFAIRKSILASGDKVSYLQMQALLLYPPDWIAANIHKLEQEEAHMLAQFPNESNLLARIAALSAFDVDAHLGDIKTDSLVIANKDDTLVPWQRSERLAQGLPQGQLALMDYGGHASSVTVADEFNNLLLTHLKAYS